MVDSWLNGPRKEQRGRKWILFLVKSGWRFIKVPVSDPGARRKEWAGDFLEGRLRKTPCMDNTQEPRSGPSGTLNSFPGLLLKYRNLRILFFKMFESKTDLHFLETAFWNNSMFLNSRQSIFRKAFFRVQRKVNNKSVCADPGSTLAPETVTPRQFWLRRVAFTQSSTPSSRNTTITNKASLRT